MLHPFTLQTPHISNHFFLRILCLSLLVLVSKIELSAQATLSFDKLSTSDGLAASKANAIIQDNKGYIWIGTWNGLIRYDGYEYRTFLPILRDSTSLSNREVVCLLEGNDSNLWIGTTSGLNYLDLETETIKSFPFSHRIISLYQDENSLIWVGTWEDGLYILDPASGKEEHFLGSYTISDICKGDDGKHWLATYNGLIEFSPRTGFIHHYTPSDDSNSISNQTVTQVKKAKDGSLWIGTWGGGLNRVTKDSISNTLHFEHYRTNSSQKNSIASDVVYRIYIDEFENIWCGSWDNGLSLMKKSEQNKPAKSTLFYTYKNDILNPESLSGNNISAICIDRSGTLWVGALNLDKCSVLESNTSFYKLTREANGQQLLNTSRSLMNIEDHLYVGTLDNIKIYNYKDGLFNLIKDIPRPSYTYQGQYYESSSILALAHNKHGLWVGTDDAGLILYDKDVAHQKNNKYKHFFNNNTNDCPLSGNKINNILVSKYSPDVLWIGSSQNGITRLLYNDTESYSSIIKEGNDEYHLSNNSIRVITEDKDGMVWIGTQNGLNLYDPETKKIQKFFYSDKDINSINDNVVNCIFEDNNGTLWFGTNTGLNKKITIITDDKEEIIAFKNYPYVDHVGNNIISSITQDKYGMLWIKPYKGLVRFDPYNERLVKNYPLKEFSLINIEKNANSQTSDGLICYGRTDGFLTLHPDELIITSRPPHICITNIKVINRSIQGRTEIAMPYTDEIRLSPDEKSITFTFSAMDFKSPKDNKYSYFLEGQDETWTMLDERNYVSFNNLYHGKYTLHLKAANSDGKWSENTLSINITVLPAWNQTFLAKLAYLLIFMALLYFFNKFSVIRAKEKSRLTLELIKSEKEQKVNELKTLFFTDITHEFRTPLTLIQGPVQEILNQKEISPYLEKQATLILRNSNRLMRLINQLMDFRKVDRGKMDIIFQSCNITDILKDVYDGYKGVALSRNIDFVLNLDYDDVIASLDTDKIEKTLFNLASNAFKYSDDGGELEIHFTISTDEKGLKSLIIEFKDDGIGIALENQERVFERFVQTHQKKTQSTGGIGLYLSKTFVEQHDGRIELESELAKGSCFRVILPYNEVPIDDQKITVINKQAIIVDDQSITHQEENEQNNLQIKHPTNKSKILIVEDDYDLNSFIKDSLLNDYEVYNCYNGNDGYELAKKHQPDVIISDIMMPELNGFEMCKLLRDDIGTSHIPIIFLTAKTMQADQLKGLQLGAVDYINKPFDLKALKLKMHNIIEARKSFQHSFKTNTILEPKVAELSSLDEKLLKDAVEAVSNNLDDPEFDVDKFGRTIGLSSNQAYRKIKALTGQTAKEFIRNQRLKAAASLFLQKKRSISEVIYMVGFSSPSYFTRCFKDYYKCTPKEYITKNGNIDSL